MNAPLCASSTKPSTSCRVSSAFSWVIWLSINWYLLFLCYFFIVHHYRSLYYGNSLELILALAAATYYTVCVVVQLAQSTQFVLLFSCHRAHSLCCCSAVTEHTVCVVVQLSWSTQFVLLFSCHRAHSLCLPRRTCWLNSASMNWRATSSTTRRRRGGPCLSQSWVSFVSLTVVTMVLVWMVSRPIPYTDLSFIC